MQIDYTGQYAAKEIDQTVSLTSHSARKSFIELWTFNYLFTQIVSLCLTNSKWCQTMLWHNFHDKLTVHEVPAFNGIICKLTLADYCLTKAHTTRWSVCNVSSQGLRLLLVSWALQVVERIQSWSVCCCPRCGYSGVNQIVCTGWWH